MSPFLPSQNTRPSVCFTDREEAGEKLAAAILLELTQHPVEGASRVVVYALPKGGLPIAVPITKLLDCPLDVIVAKKITRPDNSELAIGAVTANGYVVWAGSHQRGADARVHTETSAKGSVQPPKQGLTPLTQSDVALQQAHAHAQAQLAELAPGGPRSEAQGSVAILVDDGIATGMTMAAAVKAVRSQHPAEVWICAPVAPLDLVPFLHTCGDRVILLATPDPFFSVSRFYQTFPQVELEEAQACLRSTAR